MTKKAKTVFGTGEWASSVVNCQYGCEHDCKYCYAKASAKRHDKIKVEDWDKPFLSAGAEKKYGKRKGVIMFPTAHDITPINIDAVIKVLHQLLGSGNDLLIVSKPHLSCIKKICDTFAGAVFDYRGQILFRFTIGSADDEVLNFWEPGAPSFEERLKSLALAFNRGFKTSISCEPMLDNHIEKVVEKGEDYVTDSIWLGKMNSPYKRLIANGHDDEETMKKAHQLVDDWQCDAVIWDLYKKYKDHPKIKWKESVKKIVGIEIPTERGLDI